MANQLDELNPEIREEGLDTNVIVKKIPVEVGAGSKIFEVALWVCGIIPGVVFLFMKTNAQKHFDQLQQKIQRNASQIDNYLEQRVMVLQNCARLLDKAIDLDKSTFVELAKYRSGNGDVDAARNEMSGQIENISRNINVAVENYPDLAAHREIADAIAGITQLGLSVVISFLLWIMIASWLKSTFNLGNWIMIAGIASGLVSAVLSFLKFCLKVSGREKKNEK